MLFDAGLREVLKARARRDAVRSKPAARNFDGVGRGGDGTVQIQRVFRHLADLKDAAGFIEKRSIQVNQRVFHPKRDGARFGKHENHAVVHRERLAVHQAVALLFDGARDLKRHADVADLGLYDFFGARRGCGGESRRDEHSE